MIPILSWSYMYRFMSAKAYSFSKSSQYMKLALAE